MAAKSLEQRFVEEAHEEGQLTLQDMGISAEVERNRNWSANGRYSGSEMQRAFDAGMSVKPDDDPVDVFRSIVVRIQKEQEFRKRKRKLRKKA